MKSIHKIIFNNFGVVLKTSNTNQNSPLDTISWPFFVQLRRFGRKCFVIGHFIFTLVPSKTVARPPTFSVMPRGLSSPLANPDSAAGSGLIFAIGSNGLANDLYFEWHGSAKLILKIRNELTVYPPLNKKLINIDKNRNLTKLQL